MLELDDILLLLDMILDARLLALLELLLELLSEVVKPWIMLLLELELLLGETSFPFKSPGI